MINAKELMIGNWVTYHGETDMPCQLDAQDIFNIATGYMYNDKIHSPIPLTPEVLEKCGFERKTDYAVGIGLVDYYQVNGFSLNWIDYHKCWVVFSGVNRITIKSLHQLQNLYYAMKGEKLEYTP